MQISSRFTMAVHMFACIDTFGKECKVSSDFMAGSIGTNPVIIRKLLGQLKAAGLIEVKRGTGGVTLLKPLEEISFLDIYKAVECTPGNELFHFHEIPIRIVLLELTFIRFLMTDYCRFRMQWKRNWQR